MSKFPVLTVKKVKIHETRRGVYFSADLYLDGKRIGDVEQMGDGGADRIRPREAHDTLTALAKQMKVGGDFEQASGLISDVMTAAGY